MALTFYVRKKRTTHVRLSWMERGLRIQWGGTKRGIFSPDTVEVLLFEEYPELLDLYDGQAWNLEELHKLLITDDATALPEAVTVLLVQKDLNLLAESGFVLEAV